MSIESHYQFNIRTNRLNLQPLPSNRLLKRGTKRASVKSAENKIQVQSTLLKNLNRSDRRNKDTQPTSSHLITSQHVNNFQHSNGFILRT